MVPGEALDKHADILVTLDHDELLISFRLQPALDNIVGVTYGDIVDASSGRIVDSWKQAKINYNCGLTSNETVYGIDMVHSDPEQRFQCIPHQYSGLHVLSEVTLKQWDAHYDIGHTQNRVGIYGGDAVPRPVTIVTKRFRDQLLALGARGVQYEIVHLR
jgi:hypothetical protein